jgi:topoisomerase-4 subunit A
MVAGPADGRYAIGTRHGYGFEAALENMTSRQRAGKQFVTLGEGDTLLPPLCVRPSDQRLAMLTRKGRFLVIDLSEMKTLAGGGRGTILMGLDSGDAIEQWVCFGPAGLTASGIYRNKETVVALDAAELTGYVGKRARKGKLLAVKVKNPVLAPA